jgi:hypothetical protein
MSEMWKEAIAGGSPRLVPAGQRCTRARVSDTLVLDLHQRTNPLVTCCQIGSAEADIYRDNAFAFNFG